MALMEKDAPMLAGASLASASLASASLALAAAFALSRRWKAARWCAGIAAACAVRWHEDRMAREVGTLLAKAGRES
jgi:hypothetical protein